MKLHSPIVAALLVIAIALAPLVSVGCTAAGKRAPILVAQTGLGVAKTIGAISDAGKALQQASVLPAATALKLQEGLLKINTALAPLPNALRAIDNAQKAGSTANNDVDKALAILQVVGGDLTTLLAGVPVNNLTEALIGLVKTAQTTVQTVLIEVARLKPPPTIVLSPVPAT